ncbi:hypothetical protein MXB_4991, partial [Myxobolus squamalis]
MADIDGFSMEKIDQYYEIARKLSQNLTDWILKKERAQNRTRCLPLQKVVDIYNCSREGCDNLIDLNKSKK